MVKQARRFIWLPLCFKVFKADYMLLNGSERPLALCKFEHVAQVGWRGGQGCSKLFLRSCKVRSHSPRCDRRAVLLLLVLARWQRCKPTLSMYHWYTLAQGHRFCPSLYCREANLYSSSLENIGFRSYRMLWNLIRCRSMLDVFRWLNCGGLFIILLTAMTPRLQRELLKLSRDKIRSINGFCQTNCRVWSSNGC
jgi:hypothetical protein